MHAVTWPREKQQESSFTVADLSCKALHTFLILSAPHMSSTVLEVNHTLSYTQCWRLHNNTRPLGARIDIIDLHRIQSL